MRLLVVEDEIKIAKSLKTILESERYVVDVCYDGMEGYEQASVEEYDLLLLDWNVPTLTGIEICRKLRSEGVKTPILMLTARDRLADKVVGLDNGADDYLIKPFEVEELLARIRSLLRRESNRIQAAIEIDSLRVDTKGHTVTRGGKAIDLSYKEYNLLEFLAHRLGEVVPKQELLEHVWGGEVDPFSNVVDVYIGYVRNKIDRAFPQEKALLKTVKGLGYRLGD